MIRWLAGVALVLICARAGAQFPKSKLTLQREAAESLAPAPLTLWEGERQAASSLRVIKVRVWATRDYRTQTFDWSARFRRLVEKLNRALGYWPGVRFEVVELKSWDRDSAGLSLEALLADLERQDPASDVDYVIGLGAAVPSLPEQIHNLGMARELGRHVVLRSLHDLAEYQAVQGAFDQMSAAERDRLLFARKAHKEAVVFLHEWAHTLGLPHAQKWNRIMNPSYHQGQALFSDGEARMLELGVRQKDAPGWREALSRLVSEAPDPDWDPRDRQHLQSLLASAPPHANANVPANANANVPANANDAAEIETVVREANAGALVSALRRVQPLLSRHPDDGRLHRLACQVSAAQPAPPVRMLDRACARAVALTPADVTPLIVWAEGLRLAHLDGRADELSVRAEQLLTVKDDPVGWRAAAELRKRLGEPTLTIGDARRAGGDAALERWALTARRQMLLPSDAAARGLPPEKEGDYVRLVAVGVTAAQEKKAEVAEQLARQLDGDYPSLPAAPYVRCLAHLAQNQLAAAGRECQAALARQKDAIPPHDALAEVARRRGQPAEAEKLRRLALRLGREVNFTP